MKGEWAKHAVLILLAALTLLPFVLMVNLSWKDYARFVHAPFRLEFPFRGEIAADNYARAWRVIAPYIANSAFVSLVSVAGIVLLAPAVAYIFARHRFRGAGLLFGAVIAVLMMPEVALLIPRFLLVRDLGLMGSPWALILTYVAGGQVLAIFVLRTAIEGIPEALFESARLEGAGPIAILRHIVVPLVRPVLWTVGILVLLATWNDYLWPLVVIHEEELRTVAIGLQHFMETFSGWQEPDYGGMMAGYTIAAVPLIVVFLFAMRTFLRGLASGALKG